MSMNRLPHTQRVQVLRCLLDGMSMRATNRITGVSINAIKRLLVQAGDVAAEYHDTHVRNVQARFVEADEIWSFVYAKSKTVRKREDGVLPNDAGSIWTWTGMDSDSKLMVSYLVGGRSKRYAVAFMQDLADRLTGRVQLSTDGYGAYEDAVDQAFGRQIDYGQDLGFGVRERVCGNPNEDRICTSYIERQNLTMRMCMRRFTRATNAFSKLACRHVSMTCLYFLYYNWVRIHQSLRVTPAQAAGLTDTLHDMDWIAELVEEAFPEPGLRGKYQPRQQQAA